MVKWIDDVEKNLDSYDCGLYKKLLSEGLAMSDRARRSSLVQYYESLEELLSSMRDGFCVNSVSEENANLLVEGIRNDLSEEGSSKVFASIVAILNILQPRPLTREVLLELYNSETEIGRRTYLKRCLKLKRKEPVI